MTIYSLYIFNRHCECVYYQSWHRTTSTRPGKDVLPCVAPDTRLADKSNKELPPIQQQQQQPLQGSQQPSDPSAVPRRPGSAVLPSTRSQTQSQLGIAGAAAQAIQQSGSNIAQGQASTSTAVPSQKRGLPFDEECKLIYGVIFSLRSMVKKLSTKDDEAFIAYKTSAYKIHLFETPSGFKFVLFSDPNVDSLRFILRQIYQGAFMDFVVRNPMVELDSRISGKGIDSQAFRTSVHKFISELTIFR